MQKNELAGIVGDLHKSTPLLSAGTSNLTGLLGQLGKLSRCQSNVLVPTGDIVINDQFSTGQPNFRDFFYGAASEAGEGGNFDGNGPFLRVQPGGGPVSVSEPYPQGLPPNDIQNWGRSIATPTGTQPLKPAKAPPIRTDVDCATNDVPNLNGPQAAIGAPNPAATPFPGP
jgi:hypothetical protein